MTPYQSKLCLTFAIRICHRCYPSLMKETKWSAQILLSSNRLTKVEFISPSNLREDAEQTCKALYGVSDVRQLTRLWN